jgi:hypothetical protein
MSDLMLLGVLRMPYELAMSDELSRLQFWERAQEAANRIEQTKNQPDKCKCSFRIRMVGDGCRYCQPQEYIDRLHDQIKDNEAP